MCAVMWVEVWCLTSSMNCFFRLRESWAERRFAALFSCFFSYAILSAGAEGETNVCDGGMTGLHFWSFGLAHPFHLERRRSLRMEEVRVEAVVGRGETGLKWSKVSRGGQLPPSFCKEEVGRASVKDGWSLIQCLELRFRRLFLLLRL